jgi:hypothetical protein
MDKRLVAVLIFAFIVAVIPHEWFAPPTHVRWQVDNRLVEDAWRPATRTK